MKQINRLAAGGRIDRRRPLEFNFNGTRYEGYQGDTLASALLANHVSVVGRSFKYHRPRGIVGSGAEEPNAIFQLGRGSGAVPNVRATQQELFYDLQANSVNCWPSLKFDLGAVNNTFSRVLPAGFYYKTFMWPPSLWMKYEHIIRNAAGLGYAPSGPDPDRYDKMNAHCDVLVAGAGATGLAAAIAAARSGARVIIADEQNEFGGGLLASRARLDDGPAASWVDRVVQELASMRDVVMLPRTTVFGYYDHNFLGLIERLTDHLPPGASDGPRQRIWRVRAKQVVIAAGAIERPLVFCNNDRPGVMLASAVSTYLNRYAVAPGSRAVIFTNNDGAYQTALDLADAGVTVAAVVDARANVDGALPTRVRDRGLEVIAGHVVANVSGSKRVAIAEIMRLSADGNSVVGEPREIGCDLVAMSGGWSPAVHLHAQSGGRPRFDEAKACFVPGESVQAERSAGACAGTAGLSDCIAEGLRAGADAAQAAGFDRVEMPDAPATTSDEEHPLKPLWVVPGRMPIGRGPKQFLDLQNDTSAADIQLAAREGFESIEHVKRYTALGFGTDQGKLGNINGMAILANTLGNSIAATGTTTFRPAYTPTTYGAIAGRDVGELFDPIRKTALHAWHEEHGAQFENVGQWHRPWYFPKPGESMRDAVNRECLAVRNGVGTLDASTLGKIDIKGPDAAELLDRIYTNGWKKLALGRSRYGLMLGEDGMVMDDGVTTRLADNHYLMTTTTGGAATVLGWLERWLQTEWPALKVYLTSVTDHWATLAVSGPQSRTLMLKLCDDIDFSGDTFPFMSYRAGTVAGVAARVFRISFTGELSYEINVPANYARHVMDALVEAGERFNLTPYGTESMHVLRAEKGYVIVGQDTDGSVTADDLGLGSMVARHKDCIGKRSLLRPDCVREDRKQLVGLLTEVPSEVLPEGAQLVDEPSAEPPVSMIGHVSSSYYSACLGHSIALALVKRGRARLGETVYAPLAAGGAIKARIVKPVFYDPDGERQSV